MDGKKFDDITKGLASGLSRRQLFKAAAGGALAAMFGRGIQETDAAPSGCVSFHNTGEGCNNPPGHNCCATDLCIGDNIRNPGAGHCGSCPAGTTFCPNPNHPGFCCDNATQVCTANDCCTKQACPSNVVCGSFTDGCGGTQNCGSCPPSTDQCNDNVCTNGACVLTPKTDGTTCTGTDKCFNTYTCQSGTCTGSNAVSCTALDQCHDRGVCDPATGTCSNPNKVDGTSCNDGNACTSGDTCQAGVCQGGTATVCTALDQCHDVGTCDPATGACSNPAKADGTACSDDNACTQTDTCQGGVCTSGTNVVCTASDQCHVAGVCDPSTGACSNPAAADGTPCDDGDPCTQTDTCQAGVCVGGNPVVCTAQDQCHVAGTCDSTTGACSNPDATDGTACNDGDACTQTDTCVAGVCTGGNDVVCTASDQCHVAGTCDPATGTCSNPAAADGTACNDGDACTQTDTCQGGACVGGNPVACTALDQCHVAGTCDPSSGTCSNPNAADGTPCDDGNACTTNDTCQGGICVGGPSPCSVANCQTCSGGTCVSTCPAGTHCDGSGNCVPDQHGCTSNKDCPGPGKCCCFNSRSHKGTCSDITGCGNGTNIACLPT